MDFPQKLKTFLASTIVIFVIGVCPELDQQKLQPPSLPQPATSSIDSESPQPERLPSPSSPSSKDNESPESHLPWPAPNPNALGVSLQFVGTNQSNHQLPFSLVLLSFLVLLTLIFILVAFFIHPNCTRTSQALEKIAFLLAAAAFCHTLSIPFSFELQCTIWVVFLLSLLIFMIFAYLPLNTA